MYGQELLVDKVRGGGGKQKRERGGIEVEKERRERWKQGWRRGEETDGEI